MGLATDLVLSMVHLLALQEPAKPVPIALGNLALQGSTDSITLTLFARPAPKIRESMEYIH
jgi:hypothetical protein